MYNYYGCNNGCNTCSTIVSSSASTVSFDRPFFGRCQRNGCGCNNNGCNNGCGC